MTTTPTTWVAMEKNETVEARSDSHSEARWSPLMASSPPSMLRWSTECALDLGGWKHEALVGGDATDTASRTGIDAWLVNASARGPSRGCLHDAVDAALTLWISASASATSMVSTYGTTRMAVIGHHARRLPLRAAGSTLGLAALCNRFGRVGDVPLSRNIKQASSSHTPCAVCTC